MVPPDILICVADEVVLHEDFNMAGKLALKAQYDAAGVIMQFHYHGSVDELLDYIDMIGLDEKNVAWYEFEPHDELIDLMERDDIDPRYKQAEAPDYFVVVERGEVKHFFEYTVAEHQGRSLEDFLDEIGFSSSHPAVRITKLNLVDWEDREDWKEVEDAEDWKG